MKKYQVIAHKKSKLPTRKILSQFPEKESVLNHTKEALRLTI
jgi:hypothetical protein